MKTRIGRIRIEVAALTLLALSSVSIVAHAQQPGGPPPGGPGGGRGFGGPGGPPGGRIQPATAPVDALAAELKLTATQVDKIKAIQAAYRKDRDRLMPPPGNQGGAPPNREAMQALDKATSDKIVAVLTDDQKAALPRVIQMLDAFQSAGVPPQVIGDLKLTDDQKNQALRINKEMQQAMQKAMQDQDRQAMMDARKKAHDEILALLTDDQKAILDKFVKDHPRRGPGGPGGPGGRRGPGGPGGPGDGNGPPPGDGNGPPPPDGYGPPPAN